MVFALCQTVSSEYIDETSIVAKAILLAEDSRDDELLLKHILNKTGVENPVAVVRDGRQAILYLQGEGEYADAAKYPRPGILFLDLKMPVADGFAVLEWLKDQPNLKNRLLVVVLSHFGNADEIRRAYDLGANSFLVKPFTLADWENLTAHFDGYWIRSDIDKRDPKIGRP
jgi:CheY-like chemotaxis protein